jgi:integrase
MWRLLAVTGCRRGEVLGLRWEHVDLTAGTVTIAWQRAIAGGVVAEGATKTAAGNRTIALDGTTLAVLRSWRAQQAAERLQMGEGWAGDDWVFAWPDGTPLWPQTVCRWFREHCDTLALPPIGVHGLRHTAGTFLIGAGENPKLVQRNASATRKCRRQSDSTPTSCRGTISGPPMRSAQP